MAMIMAGLIVAACSGDPDVASSERSGGANRASGGATAAVAGDRSTGALLLAVRGAGGVEGSHLSLTLSPASVTWITDRPERDAGHMAPEVVVDAWAAFGFVSDPPNAVLVAGPASVGVELTDPVWDPVTGVLGVTIAPLSGEALPQGDLGPTELFIDDGSGSCVGPGNYQWSVSVENAPAGFDASCNQIVAALSSPSADAGVWLQGQEFTCENPWLSYTVCTAYPDAAFQLSGIVVDQ